MERENKHSRMKSDKRSILSNNQAQTIQTTIRGKIVSTKATMVVVKNLVAVCMVVCMVV